MTAGQSGHGGKKKVVAAELRAEEAACQSPHLRVVMWRL